MKSGNVSFPLSDVCSKFSPGFDVQVFHNQVFQRVFGLQIVFGVSSIFGWLYFFKMRSKLAFALGGYAFWVLRLWGELRLVRKRASSKQCSSVWGLAASSLFWFGRERIELGER